MFCGIICTFIFCSLGYIMVERKFLWMESLPLFWSLYTTQALPIVFLSKDFTLKKLFYTQYFVPSYCTQVISTPSYDVRIDRITARLYSSPQSGFIFWVFFVLFFHALILSVTPYFLLDLSDLYNHIHHGHFNEIRLIMYLFLCQRSSPEGYW